MKYQDDRTWGDKLLPQVKEILEDNLHLLVEITTASDYMDTKKSTDMVINLKAGGIAVRTRRVNCGFRDLTIRAKRDSGVKTELEKIIAGFCRWYFYGWTDNCGQITEWMLIDLDCVRSCGLLEDRMLIHNKDNAGTHFIAIPRDELRKNNCIVAEKIGSI